MTLTGYAYMATLIDWHNNKLNGFVLFHEKGDDMIQASIEVDSSIVLLPSAFPRLGITIRRVLTK